VDHVDKRVNSVTPSEAGNGSSLLLLFFYINHLIKIKGGSLLDVHDFQSITGNKGMVSNRWIIYPTNRKTAKT
jgi:hypothetical protein